MVLQLKIFVKEAFAISSMIYLTITKQKRMGGFIGSRIQTAENRIKSKGGFFYRLQNTKRQKTGLEMQLTKQPMKETFSCANLLM